METQQDLDHVIRYVRALARATLSGMSWNPERIFVRGFLVVLEHAKHAYGISSIFANEGEISN